MQLDVSPFKIIPASSENQEEVREIIFSVLREFGLVPDPKTVDNDLWNIEEEYWEKGGIFELLLDENDKIVGTFALYNCGNNIAEIRKMYFLPETRGKGLGKKVMQYLIDLAKEKGFTKLQLETASVLKGATQLYQKFGFKEINSEHIVVDRCDKAFEMNL